MRCAAHRIKIRARVRCAMCPFLKPAYSLGWWMTVEEPSARATIFSVFSTIHERPFAPRLYKSYNHCPWRPSLWPRARLRLQVLQYSESRMFCQREITTDEFEIRDGKNVPRTV